MGRNVLSFNKKKHIGVDGNNNPAIFRYLSRFEKGGKISEEVFDCIIKSFENRELRKANKNEVKECFDNSGFNLVETRKAVIDSDDNELVVSILRLELELGRAIIENGKKEQAREAHARILSIFLK